MKNIIVVFSCFVLLSVSSFAQETIVENNIVDVVKDEPTSTLLPQVKIKNLNGSQIGAESLVNELGGPTIVSFWATWCKPCLLELNTLNKLYESWQKELNVKIIAISYDDARTISKVGPMVKSKSWKFDIYTDENQELARVMGVNMIPHSFIYDASGKLIKQHNSFAPGDEETLYEELKALAGKK
jgi:cytochrome c biogenesis protein CcmG/thiol:disulfide interchange protein DsbE